MHDELSERFKSNEGEHGRIRAAAESTTADVLAIGGRLDGIQQSLDSTTNQARIVLEAMIADSRSAIEAVRG